MIIVVAALKGGVGKTTTTVYLAALAAARRPATLVDADPQASAADWIESAAGATTLLYDSESLTTSHSLVDLNLGMGTWMRAPGFSDHM